MNNTVLPWLQKRKKASLIPGYQGRSLYCISYEAENPVATVLIVHGFTENAFKYAELIWSLLHKRFSVIIFDQRGHGRSWRDQSIRDLSVTHVDHFSDYVNDLKIVCDTYHPSGSDPFFVFAHSMGGAVVSLFLEQYQDVFDAAVLSSPMIAPNTGGIPVPAASAFGIIANLLGQGKKKPFFMKSYNGPEDFSTSCATDAARFSWYDQVKASTPVFQNSVPSSQWSYEALHVTDQILAPGAPEKISCPILLYSAETDSSVLPAPQHSFIKRIANGRFIPVKGARHEIFRSSNDVLFPWWHEIIVFYTGLVLSHSADEGGLNG